jgi:hypothetical protein
MLSAREPFAYFAAEFVDRHAGKSGNKNLLNVLQREFRHGLPVAGEHCFERLDVFEFRVAFGQHRHTLQVIHHPCVHGMLNPSRAVLIEGGDAILRCDILGTGLFGDLLDESRDGLFGGAIVPRWQRVLGMNEGLAGEWSDQYGEDRVQWLHGESRLLESGTKSCLRWTKVIGGFTIVEEVVRVTASDLEMSDSYNAVSREGARVSGQVEAQSRAEAFRKLDNVKTSESNTTLLVKLVPFLLRSVPRSPGRTRGVSPCL